MKALILSNEQLHKIHQIQIELLDEFDRICRKYNIKYIICGGTLLGAIRHKGFIPWDDDIDVRMERQHYEKFCQVCDKELDKDKFFFQSYKTDKNYPWFFSKLKYNYSRYVRVGQEHLKMNDGIFMDIFISDGLPDNFFKRNITLLSCYVLKKCIYSVVGSKSENNLIKRSFYKLLNRIPKQKVYTALERIAYINSKKRTRYVADYSYPPRIFKLKYTERKWLEEIVEVEFEGKNYFTTAHYHEWLTSGYGNYMQLPPENERVGHNDVSIFYIGEENIQRKRTEENNKIQ